MKSKTKVLGRPIQSMLMTFPIAFYTASFVTFMVYQFLGKDPFWFRFAYVMTLAGVCAALLMAVASVIDRAQGVSRNAEVKRRGLTQIGLNVFALILFGINAYLYRGYWNRIPDETLTAVILTGAGWLISNAAGFQSWKLVAGDRTAMGTGHHRRHPHTA